MKHCLHIEYSMIAVAIALINKYGSYFSPIIFFYFTTAVILSIPYIPHKTQSFLNFLVMFYDNLAFVLNDIKIKYICQTTYLFKFCMP